MSKYTDQTAEFDMQAIRGQLAVFMFNNWTVDGAPYNLENLDIRMDVKEQIDIDRYAVASLRPGEGLVVNENNLTVELAGDMFSGLCKSTYYYDIVIGDTVYIRGKILLSGRVTR